MNLLRQFNRFKIKHENKLNLYLNILLICYSFLLPIADRAKSAILFGILILFFIRGNYLHYIKLSFESKIVQAFTLFFLINCIWLLGTDNFVEGKNTINDMKYLLYPLLFFSFFDKRFSKYLITGFITGLLITSFISYMIFFNIIPDSLYIYGIELYSSQSPNNPTPFLIHSRFNSLLAIASGILLYCFLNHKTNFLLKIFYLVAALVLCINIFLVAGRIGYLVLIITIFTVIIITYKKQAFKPILVTILLLITFLLLAYNYSATFKNRIDYSFNTLQSLSVNSQDYNSSFGNRLGLWVYSTKVIKENIFFGVGTGDQLDAVKEHIQKKHSYLQKLNNVHNEYIKNLLQFGLIGFVFFLNIFYQLFKSQSKKKELNSILIITTIAIMTAITTSVFNWKSYLPLLAILATATTGNNILIKQFHKTTKYLRLSVGLIILALIIDFLQRL